MNRFRRILLNALTLLSLILCLSGAALWNRSYSYVDSVIRFRPTHQYTTLWIDHRTTVTIRSGPVYEADSRRGTLRLLYLNNDGSYFRANFPARISYRLVEEDPDHVLKLAAWRDTNPLGFAQEHTPIAEVIYNAPPGPQPPPPTAYVIHAIYTPWWFWTAVFAALPATRWRSALRSRKRRRGGLCPNCGYDLRASKDLCPECGTRIAQ